METTKKGYARPQIVEYGQLEDMTLGSSGPQFDLNFINGALVPNNNSPSCTTNGPPACVSFTS